VLEPVYDYKTEILKGNNVMRIVRVALRCCGDARRWGGSARYIGGDAVRSLDSVRAADPAEFTAGDKDEDGGDLEFVSTDDVRDTIKISGS